MRRRCSILLPLLLFVRHLKLQVAKGRSLGTFLRASPLILVLLIVWSLGEMAGYLRGPSPERHIY